MCTVHNVTVNRSGRFLCDNCLVIAHVINGNKQDVCQKMLYSGDICAIILHCVVQAVVVFTNRS